ncbi:MAG: hypothetical protein BGO82_19615 [Devosia sp. 67-54]|nr:MAG: hypothetical protein BGO82_19615 [Devosia sp. 67-54]
MANDGETPAIPQSFVYAPAVVSRRSEALGATVSGRDLVEDLRSGAKPPPRAARSVGLVDIALALVAIVALTGVGYFGYTNWLQPRLSGPGAPQQPPALAAALPAKPAPQPWTDADDARCVQKARAEAQSKGPRQVISPNPSLAPGFAGMASLLECKITRKVERFCDPEQKGKLVEAVNDYLTRTDLIVGALGLQGAPMAIMGQIVGGEAAAGSGIYEAQRAEVLAFMQTYNGRVAKAIRALARDGLVAPTDFAGFLGGTPENVKALFGAALAERNICA